MKNFFVRLLTKFTALLIGDRDHNEKNEPINHAAKLRYESFKELLYSEFLVDLGERPNEVFHIAYLTGNGSVILDDQIAVSGNEIKAYVPDYLVVAERCRHFGAHEVIMIHNHPEAYERYEVGPSLGDVVCTEDYARYLREEKIDVYDHLIVGKVGVFSFRDNNLL